MGAKPSSPRGAKTTSASYSYKALEKHNIFYESKIADEDRPRTKFNVTPQLLLGPDGLYKDIVRLSFVEFVAKEARVACKDSWTQSRCYSSF